MEKDIFSGFKKIKEEIRLSQEEKDFHLSHILKFIEKRPSPISQRVIKTPYHFYLVFGKHLALSSLAVVLLVSSGLTVGAENSLPNDYLYKIKTKITEPVAIFLTPGTKKKSDIKVALVKKRLQEFSKLTLKKEKLEEEERIEFINQFSLQIQEAHDSISQLIKEESSSEALENTNSLKSILTSHEIILEKIEELNTEEPSSEEISSTVENNIEITETVTNNIIKELQNSENDSGLEKIIEDHKNEINSSLKNLHGKKGVDIDTEHLNLIDEESVEIDIKEIGEIIEKAEHESSLENNKEALILYNQASQIIEELELLIESEQELSEE